ncbi:MAG: ArsR/SmtB family transcription factor [Candidatus Aminicenantales bacterium]
MKDAPVAPLRGLKALADETRLRLFQIARTYELNVNEIVQALGMGQSRISRHLKILAEAGLLTARRDGMWTFYKANLEGEAGRFAAAIGDPEDGLFAHDLVRARRVQDERSRESRRFFDAVAGDWRDMKRSLIGDAALNPFILRHVPRCAVAADLGCGSGDLLPVLRKKADRVIGVDRAPRMLEEARRRHLSDSRRGALELRLGDLERLPLRDGEVDCAVVCLALHHLPDPGVGVAEAVRVLKPDGTLVVVEWIAHHDESLRARFQDRWLGFEPAVLERWMTRSGLTVQSKATLPLPRGLKIQLFRGQK